MSFSYRVVKTKEGFSVYEVFYDEEGKPMGSTLKPVLDFFCETTEDLRYELEIIGKAFNFPVLSEKEVGLDK